MGLGRKVGAFLGLVPEDQAKYAEGEYGGEYDRYDTGHDRDLDRDHDRGQDYDRSYDDRHGYTDGAAETDFEPRGRYADRDRFEDREPAARYPEGGFDRQRPAAGGRRSFDSDSAPVQGALAVKPDPAPPVRAVESVASHRPTTVRLTGFGEARIIGEKFRDGQSVILDMTDMSDGDARRLVDFSAGLAFALRGSIDKVAPKVFMLLPPHVDVSAAAADYHAGHADR